MSANRTGWFSPDPIERRDAARRAIKRLLNDYEIDESKIGRSLGYTQQRFNHIMTFGERASIAAGDTPFASSLLGDGHELLGAMARAAGFRLVREQPAIATATDVLTAAARVMTAASALVTVTTEAVQAGITPERARAVAREGEAVHLAVGRLEAIVSVQVVEPSMARGSGR